MRNRFSNIALLLLAGTVALHPAFGAVTVLTVPWVASNPLSPHTTYAVTGTTEIKVTLGATVPSAVGSSDSFTVNWHFGDGSPDVNFALTNPYDISTTHQYPASAGVGTAWTAVVTVNDTTNSTSGSANYYITQLANNLSSRVNVAIDNGLWYMHQTMWRALSGGAGSVPWGGWDTQIHSCNNVNGNAFDCTYDGVVDAENVQAFEVAGHLASGPATDPYTDDVARGLARMFVFLATAPNNSVTSTYSYNPATVNYTCSNGAPHTGQTPSTYPYCGPGTQVMYNASATSCTSPPCTVTFDGDSNNQLVYSNDGSGETVYTTGPFIDALVASGTPNATAPTGVGPTGTGATAVPGITGQTYKNIVQDMLDWYSACQYGFDYDIGNPASGFSAYTRGSNAGGGGWLYGCQQGDDNSTSQWGAIGLIGGSRGFGLTVAPIVTDANNVWVTNSQDVQNAVPTGTDPFAAGDDYGSFGYRGSLYYSNAWGSFATTPSGMVQMSLDGIGRTMNTTFGDASTDPDQRFNAAETYYADNFCNATSSGGYYAPRAYSYGLFSFTKSMLLHNPKGVLTPIQYLRTETTGVFPGNVSTGVPVNELDWYAAVSPANGGTDPCDGVAQTLVSLQQSPGSGVSDGHWYANDYSGAQYPFETAWSIIMLKKTVFVSCVSDLAGRGNASGRGGAQTNLTWSAQSNATGYAVLRSSTSGGGYSQVGTTNLTAYRDAGSGLIAGNTYFYVVQPLQGTTEICQSNQAAVPIPPQ